MKSKYLFQKGGSLPVFAKVILGIIVFCLVIYLIYEIWVYLYKNQTKQQTQCLLPSGCLRVLAVKASHNKTLVKASPKSKFKHNEYGICMWMYVFGGGSNSFYGGRTAPKGKKWAPVIYRGSMDTCQPGVWISKDTNRLLIRWDTTSNTKKYIAGICDNCNCHTSADLGNRKRIMKGEHEVIGVCACGSPGMGSDDKNICQNPNFLEFGNRGQQIEQDESRLLEQDIRFKKEAKKDESRQLACEQVSQDITESTKPVTNWFKESDVHYSLDPNINPPTNGSCNGMSTTIKIPGCGTSDSSVNNTPPQCCIDNIPLDRWFHLGVVGNEQMGDVYIDGKLFKSVAFNGNVRIDHNKGITVGGAPWGNYTQVRYFSSSLTPYDILKIYSWGPHPLQLEDPRKIVKNAEVNLDDDGRYVQKSIDSIHVDAHSSTKWNKEGDFYEDY